MNGNLKRRLLCKIFNMTEAENMQVEQITEFIVLFFAKFWFTTPLASAAARNDLEYGVRRVDLSFKVLVDSSRKRKRLARSCMALRGR